MDNSIEFRFKNLIISFDKDQPFKRMIRFFSIDKYDEEHLIVEWHLVDTRGIDIKEVSLLQKEFRYLHNYVTSLESELAFHHKAKTITKSETNTILRVLATFPSLHNLINTLSTAQPSPPLLSQQAAIPARDIVNEIVNTVDYYLKRYYKIQEEEEEQE